MARPADEPEADPDTTPVRVTEIVTNLDDVTGEVIGEAVERLLDEGALDAWTAAIQMKKQRPGVQLSLLCRPRDAGRLGRRVLELTGAFGLRHRDWDRLTLERTHETVDTAFGPLPVKVGRYGKDVLVRRPEFDPARRAAAAAGVPVRTVLDAAAAPAAPVATPPGGAPGGRA